MCRIVDFINDLLEIVKAVIAEEPSGRWRDALKQWKPPGYARFQILLANSFGTANSFIRERQRRAMFIDLFAIVLQLRRSDI
jgi:hypothetical protein